MSALYEKDFTAWAKDQASLLKNKDFAHLDFAHWLKEIEDMGNSHPQAMESHLNIALIHMLKQKYQPDYASKSWQDSIDNARVQIADIKENHPSLRNHLAGRLEYVYAKSKRYASKQTGIETKDFSKECPWTLNEILGD